MIAALLLLFLLATYEYGVPDKAVYYTYPKGAIYCNTKQAADTIVGDWSESGPIAANEVFVRLYYEYTCSTLTDSVTSSHNHVLWRGILKDEGGQDRNISIVECLEVGASAPIYLVVMLKEDGDNSNLP